MNYILIENVNPAAYCPINIDNSLRDRMKPSGFHLSSRFTSTTNKIGVSIVANVGGITKGKGGLVRTAFFSSSTAFPDGFSEDGWFFWSLFRIAAPWLVVFEFADHVPPFTWMNQFAMGKSDRVKRAIKFFLPKFNKAGKFWVFWRKIVLLSNIHIEDASIVGHTIGYLSRGETVTPQHELGFCGGGVGERCRHLGSFRMLEQ